MAELVLGPMLRHVDETTATVWVETDVSCEVSVLDHTARTFCVEGHFYALVIVEHLTPGSTTPYEVHLDGLQRWPTPDSRFPSSVIRTAGFDGPLRILFGSCRTAAPHEPPWSLELSHDPRGRGVDALYAHGLAMARQSPAEWAHALVLLGDQVYADDSSPQTRAKIRARRTGASNEPPDDQVADFEEYCWLYHESWRSEVERWVFSVVPTAMIFDDHEMIDDWNISESWDRDIRKTEWWEPRIVGGLMSYWIYQHLGNLGPEQTRTEGLLDALSAVDDGGPLLRDWAHQRLGLTTSTSDYYFSYVRHFGNTRLVVMDVRHGRVLTPGRRALLGPGEAAWVANQCRVTVDHLLIASSLPAFVTGGFHDLEVWNEAVCDGVWGRPGIRLGERIRQGLDLEDWPAFLASFDWLTDLLQELGGPSASAAPATISVISGDIHFSYLAPITFPDTTAGCSAVYQIVISPVRNALIPRERRVMQFGLSHVGRLMARILRHLVKRPRSTATWKITDGPIFDNALGRLTITGRRAHLTVERATANETGEPHTDIAIDTQL